MFFSHDFVKVVQLQELFDVRHSVFIIGNAGTGKTEVPSYDRVRVRQNRYLLKLSTMKCLISILF